FSSRRRHTRFSRDWSSDVCSSDLGCNTGAANRPHRLTSYLEALHREIRLVAEQLPSDVRVKRIAFGGGSPNALRPDDFLRLMERSEERRVGKECRSRWSAEDEGDQ